MIRSLMQKSVTPLLAIRDLIMPPVCWVDGVTLAAGGLNPEAAQHFEALSQQPYCHHCGLTVGPGGDRFRSLPCGRCGDRKAGVERIARVATFHEPFVTLIHRIKFGRRWEVNPLLTNALMDAMREVSTLHQRPVDVMVPIPLHWRRLGNRGFNQAELLARGVATERGWTVCEALKRQKATHAQATLHLNSTRRRNVRRAFVARTEALAGKHVWLVDDVSTTGATLHAATMALKRLPRELRPLSINAAVVCVIDHLSPAPLEVAGNQNFGSGSGGNSVAQSLLGRGPISS